MGETGKGPGPQSKAWSMDRAGPPWGQCASAQEAVSRGLEQHPMGPSEGAGGQETKSTSIGSSRRVGGPDMATAVRRAQGSSQLSRGLLWGPAQRQAPSLAVWPIRGGRFRGWKPCSPDSGEALPPPVPGLRGLKPLIAQGGLHMLLTPAWTASWGRHSQGATGVQGSHSSDRGRGEGAAAVGGL